MIINWRRSTIHRDGSWQLSRATTMASGHRLDAEPTVKGPAFDVLIAKLFIERKLLVKSAEKQRGAYRHDRPSVDEPRSQVAPRASPAGSAGP